MSAAAEQLVAAIEARHLALVERVRTYLREHGRSYIVSIALACVHDGDKRRRVSEARAAIEALNARGELETELVDATPPCWQQRRYYWLRKASA